MAYVATAGGEGGRDGGNFIMNLPGDGIKGGGVEADGDPRFFFVVSNGEVSGVNVFASVR
jgi:hypothetical protein